MVEDNRRDVLLIREALEIANVNAELHVLTDGEKAVRFFADLDQDDSLPCPALVLIDINLPKKQGAEVLEYMRGTRRCVRTPVLVVTSSDSSRDRGIMAKLGVSGYFRKPSQYDAFMQLGQLVKELLLSSSRADTD